MGDLSIDLVTSAVQLAAANPWPVRMVACLAVALSKEDKSVPCPGM